ncbi:hypothetical protein NDU88_000756 [Pleurodeles waltl]|uniref:Uncharacterized protein n=1 Tax=Pleurodeles waltl TaxID=8319 RepID=A0AAV7Q423_PLEWA|nr:hypothetical protein NDU88_000756 [Pleurodeles waltl]
MAGSHPHKKDASIRDLLTKKPGKRTDQSEEVTQLGQSSMTSDATKTTDDTEPVTHTFLEPLFGALCADIATLEQYFTKDIKGLTKNVNELGDRVDSLERIGETQGEELDAHRCEILELQDRNAELRYQVEDLEHQSRRADIRIKGVPLQAAGGNLERADFSTISHRTSHHK